MKVVHTPSLGEVSTLACYFRTVLTRRSFCWGFGGVAGAIIGGTCA